MFVPWIVTDLYCHKTDAGFRTEERISTVFALCIGRFPYRWADFNDTSPVVIRIDLDQKERHLNLIYARFLRQRQMTEYTVDSIGVVSLAKILGLIGLLWG